MEKNCIACGKLKKIDSFGKNKQIPGGIEKRCKICKNNYNKKYREQNNISSPKGPHLTGLGKNDWCKMYQFLEKIGYDIQGDIHKQFAEKHNLPYKQRPTRNKINYLPTDCLDGNDVANPLTEQ